jgi:dTDP-glucose 4,6-dehydratase
MKFKNIKKIFITGGCGFIGSHLSEFFFNKYKEAQIIIYDKITYAAHISNIQKILKDQRVVLIKKDICDLDNLIKYSRNTDLVIHAAAESHVDNSFVLSDDFIRTNVLGTKYVMEACLINKIHNIIHISTDEVYGQIFKGKFKEDSRLNPSNPYSSSKAAAEMIVMGYIKSYKLPVKIVRPNNIYGTRQHPEKLIAGCIWCIVKKKKFKLHGNGNQKRTFLHVHDFCRSVDIIIKKGKNFEFYNVGTNQEFKNRHLLKLICNTLNVSYKNLVTKIPDRIFNDARYSICHKKIRKLGWCQQKKMHADSLKEIFSWTQKNLNNFSR